MSRPPDLSQRYSAKAPLRPLRVLPVLQADVAPGGLRGIELSTVDSRGRLAARATAATQGWQSDTFDLRLADGDVLHIDPDREGPGSLDPRGRLLIPGPLRDRVGLEPKRRALVVALPDGSVAVLSERALTLLLTNQGVLET